MTNHWEQAETPERVLKTKEQQIRQLYGQSWMGMSGILAAAGATCVILWGKFPYRTLLIWFGVFLFINVVRQIRCFAFTKARPVGRDLLVWANQHVAGSFASAVAWAVALLFLWPSGDPVAQLLISIIIASVSSSAVALYYSWKQSYLAYLTIPMPLCSIRLLLEQDLLFRVIGLLGLLLIFILAKSGRLTNETSREVLLTSIRNTELSSRLLEEKMRQNELNGRLAEEISARKRYEKKIQERNIELESLNHDLTATKISLEESIKSLNQLSGLLPICAACKKIRNDDGYWEQLETYLHAHSEVQFSHGICPECSRALYPEVFSRPDNGASPVE